MTWISSNLQVPLAETSVNCCLVALETELTYKIHSLLRPLMTLLKYPFNTFLVLHSTSNKENTRNFLRRTVHTMNKETYRSEQSNRRITFPYVRNVSELTAWLFQSRGSTISDRLSQTLGRLVLKPKERLKWEKERKKHFAISEDTWTNLTR